MDKTGKVYFYGTCLNGTRLHTGHEVVPYVHDDKMLVVQTHCGNQMFVVDEGERPPSYQTDDLCRTCHRSYAWDVMSKVLASDREAENWVARRLEEFVSDARADHLSAAKILDGIEVLAGNIRYKQDPTKEEGGKPRFRLVERSA